MRLFVRNVLSGVGLFFITAGAFMVLPALGLVVGGVCLLFVSSEIA